MAAIAKRVKQTPDPVATAAKAALANANGDARLATQKLEEAVRKDRVLRDQLLEPLISNACYDAIRAQCGRERRAVWKAPVEKLVPKRGGPTGTVRVVQLAAGTLLMFPLPGGKHLGDATREDIAKAASAYASQSEDMAVKARWLQLVLQSLPEGKKVGEVLTDKRLRELQKEASRAE